MTFEEFYRFLETKKSHFLGNIFAKQKKSNS